MNADDMFRGVATIATTRDPQGRKIAARVHLGRAAYDRAYDAAGHPADERREPHPHDQMFGLPIVIGSLNNSPPLDDLGWRVVDEHGAILASGVLE